MGKLNYTGIHLDDSSFHVTWKYGTPLIYPENVKSGDKAEVTVVGKYQDAEVACFIVTINGIATQPSGTLLHFTTKAIGAKPVESGLRATKKGYAKIKHYTLTGVWK